MDTDPLFLLRETAKELWSSCLHGRCEAESPRIRYKRMETPVKGDYVYEMSTSFMDFNENQGDR